MIEVTVNGEPKQVAENLTISALLEVVDIPGPYLAVELNEEVIPREKHDQHPIAGGDRVEVVTLVGGG